MPRWNIVVQIKNNLKMPTNDTILSYYMTAFHFHTKAYRRHFVNQNRWKIDLWCLTSFCFKHFRFYPCTLLKTPCLASPRYYFFSVCEAVRVQCRSNKVICFFLRCQKENHQLLFKLSCCTSEFLQLTLKDL